MDWAEKRRSYSQEPAAVSDEDLIALLLENYTADKAPPSRVCGGKREIPCAGSEPDTERPERMCGLPSRTAADMHYEGSRWTQHLRGDENVLELVSRHGALQQQANNLFVKTP